MDLAPLSQALTLDGSYIHECMWISWKYNKDERWYTYVRTNKMHTFLINDLTQLNYPQHVLNN